MVDVPTKSYWLGRDIETLSREELLDVVRSLGRDLEEARRSIHSMVEIHELARRVKTNQRIMCPNSWTRE